MTIGIWVLGDQLYERQTALLSCVSKKSDARVVLIESLNHIRQRPYHRQKLVLIWSAMRHFAKKLEDKGWLCDYIPQSDDFTSSLRKWVEEYSISEVRLMEPNDTPFLRALSRSNLPVETRTLPSNHFMRTKQEFTKWAEGRKRLVMEYFYRESRRRYGILMEDNEPIGGTWNYDKENRKPPKEGFQPPSPLWFDPDVTTREVIELVDKLEIRLFGNVEPFRWAVTRTQALSSLRNFIDDRLELFGPYEDAMVSGQLSMWHSLISPYLNIGLLRPREIVTMVEDAFHNRDLPIQSVEGFIRQIVGWREYLHGIYQMQDDEYQNSNFFNHSEPLPSFFWTGDTEMNCMREVLKQVIETGYAHHIQRLMILSNYALISGLVPQETENWFHAAFIDSFDWVMQTNVIGMGLFADGGLLATKPYAASANYIRRMSDYCGSCKFNSKNRTGVDACPFNFLYWDFLERNREKLESLGRMNLVLNHLDNIEPKELEEIKEKARKWINIGLES